MNSLKSNTVLLREGKTTFCYYINLPFNSQKWFKSNFSLQYPKIIQQAGKENTQTYQV